MSKHKRKTKRQKILSDLHRKIYSLRDKPLVSVEKSVEKIQEEKQPKIQTAVVETLPVRPAPPQGEQVSGRQVISAINQNTLRNYPFLIADISKTAMVTGAILAIQILLFLLLKSHILSIPGIGY
ncbi:MAG: hypothetical protein A2629_01755 [Candidatus Levybacteria bacterium RIFCSPHIGHO2_01_FULL_41_15]|nr:MAG: hypothetical protein A2629_01755 [Candidatus Levybacteria bacterium RIFCSPHIGHO2_01_FULL_41_15]